MGNCFSKLGYRTSQEYNLPAKTPEAPTKQSLNMDVSALNLRGINEIEFFQK